MYRIVTTRGAQLRRPALTLAIALVLSAATFGVAGTPAARASTDPATCPTTTSNPFPIAESFQYSSLGCPDEWVLGGNAALTQLSGNYWMELTSAGNNQEGYVYNTIPFSPQHGLDLTFQYASYDGTGADGMTFFLMNGAVGSTYTYSNATPGTTTGATFSPGPVGGSLGYADCPSAGTDGLTGAFLGIGFDDYGNFANNYCDLETSLSSYQGTGGAGLAPDYITVRDGVNSASTTTGAVDEPNGTNYYQDLISVKAADPANPSAVLSNTSASAPITVNVSLVPGTSTTCSAASGGDQAAPCDLLSVYDTYADGGIQTVLENYGINTANIPSTLKFGWVSSTGGSDNIHAVENTTVALPADLTTTVTPDPTVVDSGGNVAYTATVTNNGTNPVNEDSLVASDLTGDLSNVSWTCSASGGAVCPDASGTGLPDFTSDSTSTIPVGGSLSFAISGTTSATSTQQLQFTATPQGDTTQSVSGDNTATATTEIGPAVLTAPVATLSDAGASVAQGTYSGDAADQTISDAWYGSTNGTTWTAISGCAATTSCADSNYASDGYEYLRVTESATNDTDSRYTVSQVSNTVSNAATATLSNEPPAVSASASSALAFSSTEAGATYQYSLDGGTWQPNTGNAGLSLLANGSHTIEVQAVYGGLVSTATPTSYTWVVDTTTPSDTVGCQTAQGGGVNADGWFTATPTCTVTGADSVSGSGIASVSYTVYGPGSTTTVYATGTTTNADSIAVSIPESGTYTLDTVVVNDAGTQSTTSQTIKVDSGTVAAPAVTAPAAGSYQDSSYPAFGGTGTPGDTVTVDVDGMAVCTATVSGSGSWSCTSTAAISNGTHEVTATQTDADGKTSIASAARQFYVDTQTVSSGSASGVSAGSGSTASTNSGGSGSTTYVSTTTPTFTGTGTPGDTVTVYVDGQAVGTATVGSGGTWSVTSDVPLSDGQHVLTITETDRYGKVSAPSAPLSFVVAPAAPAAPVAAAQPDATTTASGAAFRFADATAGVGYRYSLDGGSWVAGGAAYSLHGLRPGVHSLAVEAVTPAGVVSGETVITWTVYAKHGARGMPTRTRVLANAKMTASARHGVDVEVSLNAGSIHRAVVLLYHDGRLIGRTTRVERSMGHTHLYVRVLLNAYGRRLLLRSGATGVGIQVRNEIQPFAFRALSSRFGARLYMPYATLAVTVHFATASAALTAADRRELDQHVAGLKRVRDILVAGNTDSVGARGYNYGLGLERARTVVAYLRARGVDAHLATVSHGLSEPVASNDTAAGRALNRSATVAVTYYDVA